MFRYHKRAAALLACYTLLTQHVLAMVCRMAGHASFEKRNAYAFRQRYVHGTCMLPSPIGHPSNIVQQFELAVPSPLLRAWFVLWLRRRLSDECPVVARCNSLAMTIGYCYYPRGCQGSISQGAMLYGSIISPGSVQCQEMGKTSLLMCCVYLYPVR